MASILLIDDEPTIQTVLQQMLRAGGHEVTVARIGHELLEDLQLRQFDLVITDLNMPVLDGWNVASWIRERRPGVPVIAIGGNAAFRANDGNPVFAAILQKPFRRAELLATVSSVLDGMAGRSSNPGPVE
jgi:two-component system, cell cycle response regulator CpdR